MANLPPLQKTNKQTKRERKKIIIIKSKRVHPECKQLSESGLEVFGEG
jgi:hypothetical protein